MLGESEMKVEDRYDVVIAGGGLAGLCLALQIKRATPTASILVAEKTRYPQPKAAHKVGESSVEVASHYFREVLGLSELLAKELPKFGLRFFMSHGTNEDISTRLECGPSNFLYVPSFQIDRGQFENALAEKVKAAGVKLLDGCRIESVAVNDGALKPHRVGLACDQGQVEVTCRWLVDASGRAALLKKKLGLERSNRHDVNAAWFRVDHPIDPDDWSNDPGWRNRLKESRRLSTNHLMGPGYWVWLIPLAHDRTSVGIVANEQLHPFKQISSFEKALDWLDAHEPQCADVVREHLGQRMDFLALRHYSHDAKQMYSADRWCLTGDAGMFVDPFYSPGSDFVGISNSFVTDMVRRDLAGEDIHGIVPIHDQAFTSLAHTYLRTYYRQYPLMGQPRIMTTKVVWDFVMYWGGVALLFCRDKLTDPAFMARVRPVLQAFAATNIAMQAHFRTWAAKSQAGEPPEGVFIDYAKLGFLAELNRRLMIECDEASVLEQLDRNLALAKELEREILAEAAREHVSLGKGAEPPTTQHLDDMFARMRG